MISATKEDFSIREAKRTDIGSFAATIARAKTIGKLTPKTYLNWIVREGFAFVAEEGERKSNTKKKKAMGFLLAERDSKVAAHVNYLYVHPRHRGQGVGSILMQHFLGTCRKKGIRYVDLHSKDKTAGFYRTFGFKSEGKYTVLFKRLRPN
ncbi:MAG: N-acetyltransferase [Nanoarchaeota archaeon]